MKHLHLQDFKQLYKKVKTPIPYVNWLILGFLVHLEQQYIHIKVNTEIDAAINSYKQNDTVITPEIVKHDDGSFSIGDIDRLKK